MHFCVVHLHAGHGAFELRRPTAARNGGREGSHAFTDFESSLRALRTCVADHANLARLRLLLADFDGDASRRNDDRARAIGAACRV